MGINKQDDTGEAKESFEQHFRLLESFANDLQDNKVSIDSLINRMKDALKSVKICKAVLARTASQLQELKGEFAELEEGLETAE